MKINHITFTLALLLALCASALAQTATITLQVTDAQPQAWNGGTWSVTLTPQSGTSTSIFKIVGTGTDVPNQAQSGALNGTGGTSVVVTPNTSISPANTQWMFSVCPLATAACFQQSFTITGNVSLTIQPPAILINLNVPLARVTAYNDNEVTGQGSGSQYFNLTSLTQRIWNGTTWSNIAGVVGLADPGSNGVLKRTAPNVTAIAVSADIIALWSGTCNITSFLRGDGTCASGIGAPGGSNTQIQFNNSGSFGGITNVAAGSWLASQGASTTPVFQTKVFADVRDFAGATSDVQITNAIASLPASGGKIEAFYTTAQSWAACPTWGSNPVHLRLSSVTFTVAVNCSIPANVTLEFTQGAILSITNATTTTILGNVIAGRQQIFSNALAGQGTISMTASTKTLVLYPEWFGAKKDGVADDTAALQATTDVAGAATASNPGPATVDLGCGVYKLLSQWTIATSNGQHHVNVTGGNPLCTTINATVAASPATAIYVSKEKFVTLSNFFLHSNTLHVGTGITLAGLTGSGTQTNGSTLSNIIIDSFDLGMATNDPGVGTTSSEILFNELVFQNNNTGFANSSFNGLNYVFNNLQITNNTVGVSMNTPGIVVNGGAGSANGKDFVFLSGFGTNTIIGFRSETAVTNCIDNSSPNLTVIEMWCAGLSTPASHTAIRQHGAIRIQGSYIGGQITNDAGGNTSISDSWIIDPSNTWTLTAQPQNMGPGFRITAGGASGCGTLQDCGHFDVRNTEILDASNVLVYRVPSVSGWYTQGAAGNQVAIATNMGQGPALTVSGNAINVNAYVHHVGAGLIKNIVLPTNVTFPNMGTVNWEMPCIQLIADAIYSTDTTGNIAVALTSATGQVITWCLDPVAVKWYPSIGNPSGTFNCTNVTSVTVSTSTTNDQNLMACTIPANVLNTVNRTLRIHTKSLYSTPVASVATLTFKAKLCSVSGCGSGNIATLVSITSSANPGTVTNNTAIFDIESTTQTGGAASRSEASGDLLIDLGAAATSADTVFADTNATTVAGSPADIDFTTQNFLQITVAFSVASGSNSVTERQLIIDTVN